MTLLNQIAPGLERKIEALSIDQCRRVVAKTAEKISPSIKDLERPIHDLLKAASSRNTLSPDQVAELRSYAATADDRYLSLQEEGAESLVWRNWFAKARLATSLADVFGGSTHEVALEAVYELCFVKHEKSAVIALVNSEIQLLDCNE